VVSRAARRHARVSAAAAAQRGRAAALAAQLDAAAAAAEAARGALLAQTAQRAGLAVRRRGWGSTGCRMPRSGCVTAC
jgi:hypothetical protein